MPLTDVAVRKAKPGIAPRKLSDGFGLHLLVTPAGGKLWRLQYRFYGKQKTLAFGAYPDVTLSDARNRTAEARKHLSSGVDPADVERAEKAARLASATNTFGVVAGEFLEKLKREGRADITLSKKAWLLRFASPLDLRPINEISAVEVLSILQKLERRGLLESARRLRSTIGCVFRYGIATARASSDPTLALRGAIAVPKSVPRAAITDADKFGELLRDIDKMTGQRSTRIALQLMAFLFPRPGELRLAEWAEFDFDKTVWTIPSERTKMKREHRVPLPRQSLELLRELKGASASRLVLPSVSNMRKPMSENTLNDALRRIGYAKEEITAHGFRATASSLLNESGLWHPDAIERQLGHMEQNAVRRAYARSEHWHERIKMMDWWANYLDELKLQSARAA